MLAHRASSQSDLGRLTFAQDQPQPAHTILDLPLQRIAAIHAVSIVPEFGDFYGVCSCGARSLPIATPGLAATWKCPLAEAEWDVAIAARLYEQRVADAHLIER